MSARKYANAKVRSGLLPPRLKILHRGLTIAVAAESSNRDVERRTSRSDKVFQRGDIRAQARQQQIQDVLVLEDLGRNPSVATVDFGDKNMIREMTDRRKPIGHSRRLSARHDQMNSARAARGRAGHVPVRGQALRPYCGRRRQTALRNAARGSTPVRQRVRGTSATGGSFRRLARPGN